MILAIGMFFTLLISWLTGSFIWKVVYPFLLSFVPTGNDFWMIKLAITFVVAWFGGIGIPMGILIWGTILTFAVWTNDK